MVFKGSARSEIQSSEQSRRRYGTWNEDLTLQRMGTLKNANSESTHRFAAVEDEYYRNFPECQVNTTSTKTTCGLEEVGVSQICQSKDGIIVKNEVNVDVSASDGEARTWRPL